MNVFLKAVKPANAPKALGPYSPAVKLGDFRSEEHTSELQSH